MSDTQISVSDTVDAPVERVFALLADPDRHPDLDGSGTVRASHTHLAITEVGDVFVMEMEHPERGRYTVENHVVRYEPDQALAWAPAKPGAQPSGHVWSWEFTPTDDDHTVVSHTHDWSAVTHEPVLARVREVGEEEMRRSIGLLAEALG
ncbi:MAG: hypothetical protein K0S40_1586 [Actinomycetospora sp.]|nr:hypothetical protein [Actinomycetospora sp.]